MIKEYGRNANCRDANLMGFSLSPIRLNELTAPPFARWNATNALKGRFTKHRQREYLSVVPSSWGVAYWSDRWREFSFFVDVRAKAPFYSVPLEEKLVREKRKYDGALMSPAELHIPNSRSNVWPRSWKRFMVDFMYARGLLMLYPCLDDEKGLATTLALSGEHVESSIRSIRSDSGVWAPAESDFARNARVAPLAERQDLQARLRPRYGDLAVLGLHLNPRTREELALDGAAFFRSVSAYGPKYMELVQVWKRPTHLNKVTTFEHQKPTPPQKSQQLPTDVSTNIGRGKTDKYYSKTHSLDNFALGKYKLRNVAMAAVINALSPSRVFEFAGSGGYFAREVWRHASENLTHYTHSDFTDVSLKTAVLIATNPGALASEMAVEHPDTAPVPLWLTLPPLPFRTRLPDASKRFDVEIRRVDVVDFFGAGFNQTYAEIFDLFTTISFEHFDDDLGILRRLPKGSMFVFCVPNFDAPAHMRHFDGPDSVRERYDGDLVTIKDIVTIVDPDQPHIEKYIVTAVRLST